LYEVAESVGIPRERIIFTEHVDKIVYLKDKNFIFHLDDDREELTAIITSGDKCVPVCVENDTWLQDCKDAMKKRSVENFKLLVKDAPTDTGWLKEAQYRVENEYWINNCNNIQIRILSALDDIGSNLDEMCEKIDIDRKCCSGPFDFKLSELKRIEKYLSIKIVDDGYKNK
jgi:hypothetical protein